ncbi:15066_t:CDS:2 [Cetraspora pellucida]|uniref:15066_t:CDS:1 n=1 Tax=Cetraspora pellucida TaxID=1433469 RepID=A0ACA9K2G8_9GLOM|nr:15066_t:CDS:2 [Cetraspora pellucida]
MPKLFSVDRTGTNKYTAIIKWDGTLIDDKAETFETDFDCIPKEIVDVANTPQHTAFGDRKVDSDSESI